MELRRKGRVLSQVDIMVASLARQMNLTVLSTNRDFKAVANLRTDDWSKK
jgi:predicted nucleic acid-binding protein